MLLKQADAVVSRCGIEGVTDTVPSQLSRAEAVAAQVATAAASKHCIVRAAAGTVITGAVLSRTVNEAVAKRRLPQASTAVNVTETGPTQLLAGAV